MRAYITHRLVTLGLFGLLLASIGTMLASGVTAWWWLLVAVTVFGYTHYIVGGFYQARALARSARRQSLFAAAGVLTLLSLLLAVWFWYADAFFFLSFLVIVYFLWHGYENELTLFEKQTGRPGRRDTVGALVLTTLAIALFGVGHASWYFTPWYEFLVTDGIVTYTNLPGGVWLPLLSFLLACGAGLGAVALALHACIKGAREYRLFHCGFFAAVVVILYLCALYYPVHYVVVLGGLLFYHFLVWFLFYDDIFKTRGDRRELMLYRGLHILIALPFVLYVVFGMFPTFALLTLNSYTFLTLTLIHISLSLLNESWFRRLFTLA